MNISENPNKEIMKVVIDEEKQQILNFIRQSTAEEIYDRIYILCAFDIAYRLLNSRRYATDEVANKVAGHPNIMTDIIKTFDNDDDRELTPEYINTLILEVLDSYESE